MSLAATLGQAPVGLQRTVRGHVSYARRWLRAAVEDVVRLEPRNRPAAVAPARPLLAGLRRWRARVELRRAAVLARRWLVVALAVGMLLALIGMAAGASSTSRALWLIGPAFVWVVGVGAGFGRDRVSAEDVARLLDRDLALAEVVSTALELERRSSPDGAPSAAGGLPARVLADGSAAVADSLAGARAVARSTWPESVVPVALAGVVALIIALPASGTAPAGGGAASRPGAGAVARRAGGSGGASRSRGLSPGSSAPRASTSASRPGASKRRTAVHAGARQGGGHGPAASGGARARGGASGTSTAGSSRQRSTGALGTAGTRGAGTGHAGAAGRAGAGAAQAHAGGGRGATQARATGGRAGGTSASRTATAGSSVRAGRPGASPRTGQSGASASKASPGLASRSGAAGGESAGKASAGNPGGFPPSAPGSVQSVTRLAIQTGYRPGVGGSTKTANGPALTGGYGPARNATLSGAGGTGATVFPYIPPTPSLLSPLDQEPVLSYFGPFSLILSATWR